MVSHFPAYQPARKHHTRSILYSHVHSKDSGSLLCSHCSEAGTQDFWYRPSAPTGLSSRPPSAKWIRQIAGPPTQFHSLLQRLFSKSGSAVLFPANSPAYYADYISQVVTAHTMMLASFDFSTIQSGTFQISDVERFMTLTDDRKAANELRYVDLNSAFQAVADQNATRQERQESYEKYEAEQEKRVQELKEKISAIYSRWDEY